MQDDQKKDEKEIGETLDFSRPDYVFMPKGVHVYRQQGFYLICQSCELSHAVFIGSDKIMVGEKDGQPILKKRKEVGM